MKKIEKYVKKRDGRIVPFEIEKIENAICKAMDSTRDSCDAPRKKSCHELALAVKYATYLDYYKEVPTVEQIQDEVISVLFKYDYDKEAMAYSKYRKERTKLREKDSKLMNIFKEIVSADSIDSDMKRDNGNVDGDSTMGSMLKFGSESSKYYSMLELLESEHAEAHQSGDIHIHDLDFYALGTFTCCQIPLAKVLKDGFSTGHGYLREPNSIGSYASLACIVLQSNQNDMYGGQAISDFCSCLGQGVKKSFAKNYKKNLVKALTLKNVCAELDKEKLKKEIDLAFSHISNVLEIELNMRDSSEYFETEMNILGIWANDMKEFGLCQKYAFEEAYEETDRETYQAMESLIHNLNTMNSRAG